MLQSLPSGFGLHALLVVVRTFKPYRWHVLTLVFLGTVGALLDGIGISAIIPMVSFLVGSAQPTDVISELMRSLFGALHIPFTFRYLAGFIAILFVARAIVLIIFSKVRGYINGDFTFKESSSLYRATLSAPWDFISKEKLGYLQNTIQWDVKRSAVLLDVLAQLIQSVTGFLMYFLVAVNISWPVTIATTVAGVLLLMTFRPLLKRSQQYGHEIGLLEKKLSQHLGEHLSGFKVVKVSGVKERAAQAFDRLLDRLQKRYAEGIYVQQLSQVFFQPVGFVLIVILFYVTYRNGTFNLAVFAAVLYLIQKTFTYLQTVQSSFHTIADNVPYSRNVLEFRRLLAQISKNEELGEKPFNFAHELSLKDVSLSYGERGEALKDVSMKIRRGEVVGIIGPSGAGKTSLADLLLRLYRSSAGTITLDGVPIEEIKAAEWREHLGYVPQEVVLFNGTIEENIRFYRDELSSAEVEDAAKKANIYEFIKTLPDGFDTVVGDRGVMLSGGQRQRVALARVLAGSPELMVLDEATSALDTESERLIHEAIYRLRGGMTVVLIAHRLSTVADADRLFVFERGRLAEEGAPAELLKNPDSYYTTHMREK